MLKTPGGLFCWPFWGGGPGVGLCCFVVYSVRRFLKPCLVLFCSCVFRSFWRCGCLAWGGAGGGGRLVLVHFVRLFGLRLFGFVRFLLVSGKGCGLWLCHSLDFSLTFLNTRFGSLLELPHGGDSNKYPKRMFYEEIRTIQDLSCIPVCSLQILYNSKFILTKTSLGTNAVVLTRGSMYSVFQEKRFDGYQKQQPLNESLTAFIEATQSPLICSPSEKGFTLDGKNLLPCFLLE